MIAQDLEYFHKWMECQLIQYWNSKNFVKGPNSYHWHISAAGVYANVIYIPNGQLNLNPKNIKLGNQTKKFFHFSLFGIKRAHIKWNKKVEECWSVWWPGVCVCVCVRERERERRIFPSIFFGPVHTLNGLV